MCCSVFSVPFKGKEDPIDGIWLVIMKTVWSLMLVQTIYIVCIYRLDAYLPTILFFLNLNTVFLHERTEYIVYRSSSAWGETDTIHMWIYFASGSSGPLNGKPFKTKSAIIRHWGWTCPFHPSIKEKKKISLDMLSVQQLKETAAPKLHCTF